MDSALLNNLVAILSVIATAAVAIITAVMSHSTERERIRAERERFDIEYGEVVGLKKLLSNFKSKQFETLLSDHYPTWNTPEGKERLETLLRKAGAVRWPGGQGGVGLWGLPEKNEHRMG